MTLPLFSQTRIKAKVDTGAKTSSLHAHGLTLIEDQAQPLVRFELHPYEDCAANPTTITAPVVDFRTIRSSNGQSQRRPVIRTELRLGDLRLHVDLTLTARHAMGHRLLLGRRLLEHGFVVDPSRSFLMTGRSLV